MSTLEIRDLQVSVKLPDGELKPILAGVDLTVRSGETHAIMGPNGSGKSTLAYSIAGHPKYQITGGTVTLDGAGRARDDRRRAGPRRAVPGHAVPGRGARRVAWPTSCAPPRPPSTARRRSCAPGAASSRARWSGCGWTRRSPSATSTRASPAARRSGTRSCSWSCSSRRSRSSTRPTPASTSTRCAWSARASTGSATTGDTGVLLITHYTRILRYVKPDFVHVFVGGRIVEEGGPELAEQLEAEGYERYVAGAGSARA